jgi:hypothetical protein
MSRRKQEAIDKDFMNDFLSFKSDWDLKMKERGVEVNANIGKLTQANLKKMERQQEEKDSKAAKGPQEPSDTSKNHNQHKSNFSKQPRFKEREKDDKTALYP